MANTVIEYSEMTEDARDSVKALIADVGDSADVDTSGVGAVYVDYTGDNWALYFTVEDDGAVSFDLDFTADGPVDISKLDRFTELLRAIDAFNAAAE